MVLEVVFDFGLAIYKFIFDLLPDFQGELVGASSLFLELLSFGVWVIGDNMWVTILTNISVWLTFKITVGLVLFIYKLLPLT